MKTQDKEMLEPISQKLDYLIEKLNKISFPTNNTSNQTPTVYQFKNLEESFKMFVENNNKLVEHFNKSNPIISKKLSELTEEVGKLNVTVESKLSKKLMS